MAALLKKLDCSQQFLISAGTLPSAFLLSAICRGLRASERVDESRSSKPAKPSKNTKKTRVGGPGSLRCWRAAGGRLAIIPPVGATGASIGHPFGPYWPLVQPILTTLPIPAGFWAFQGTPGSIFSDFSLILVPPGPLKSLKNHGKTKVSL